MVLRPRDSLYICLRRPQGPLEGPNEVAWGARVPNRDLQVSQGVPSATGGTGRSLKRPPKVFISLGWARIYPDKGSWAPPGPIVVIGPLEPLLTI